MPRIDELGGLLAQLQAKGLYRDPEQARRKRELREKFGDQLLDVSSNDYLGLGRRPRDVVSRETARAPSWPPPGYSLEDVSRETPLPPGSGASRLIFGTHPTHEAVEQELASWIGTEAALLFASGYAANVGALSAVLGRDDLVVSDELNHASIIDGIRLSKAKTILVPHLDLVALEQALQTECSGAKWVVVEAWYSMDGDGPDLAKLAEICRKSGAQLYVDEAHSFGLFGAEGKGLCAAAGVAPDVLVAAFGKSVGSHGACVAGSKTLRAWLWNRARSFVFSTAPSPRHTSELLEQLHLARTAEDERKRALRMSRELRERLQAAGAPLPQGGFGPILALVVGSAENALALASRLAERGVCAQAIRPPTVPEGKSRLRLTVTAALEDVQLENLAQILLQEFADLGLLEGAGK